MKLATRTHHWLFSDEPNHRLLSKSWVHASSKEIEILTNEDGAVAIDVDNKVMYQGRTVELSFPTLTMFDGKWALPRHCLTPQEVKSAGYTVHIERPVRQSLPRHIHRAGEMIKLRKNGQDLAYEEVMKHENGFVVLAPGKGKTVLALKAMCVWNEPTLILFHDGGLLQQWRESIDKFIEPRQDEVGLVQSRFDKWTWKRPIVLGMLKSFYMQWSAGRIPDEFYDWFGTVIWDEAHHLAAPTHLPSIGLFNSRRLALTATPERDGWEQLLYQHIGPVLYEDLSQELKPKCHFNAVRVSGVHNYSPKNMMSYGKLVTDCIGGPEQAPHPNYYSTILACLQNAGARKRKTLVVSQRKDIPYDFQEDLPDLEIIDGSVKGKHRTEKLRASDIITVTPRIGSEGLDRVDLDYIVILFPLGKEARAAMRQTIGRILRVLRDKDKPAPEMHMFFPETLYGKTLAAANEKMCEELGYEIERSHSVILGSRRRRKKRRYPKPPHLQKS